MDWRAIRDLMGEEDAGDVVSFHTMMQVAASMAQPAFHPQFPVVLPHHRNEDSDNESDEDRRREEAAKAKAAAAAAKTPRPNGRLNCPTYAFMFRAFQQKDGPNAAPATFFSDGAHLCSASSQGAKGMVKALIEILNIPVEAKEVCGRTALHCAAMCGHADVIQYLLDKGAKVDAQDAALVTPLHLAAWNKHLAIARYLVERGADVNAKIGSPDEHLAGKTALHLASECGHLAVCNLLISKGASVNATSVNGFTPIYMASGMGHLGVVNFLLDHGADPDRPCILGVTPLQIASSQGHYLIVQLLLRHLRRP